LEYDLSPVPPLERGRGLGGVSVTLAEIMADTGHYSIDSTTLRAHVSAAGGKGGLSKSFGRSRGGFSSKLHCLADAQGRPIAFHLTHGEAADCTAYTKLIDLPERAPKALLADKGCDTNAIRADLARREISLSSLPNPIGGENRSRPGALSPTQRHRARIW
jgi:transposase